MTNTTLKTRVTRLAVGLLIAGSSTTALFGGTAHAARAVPPTVAVTYAPNGGQVIAKGQVNFSGSAGTSKTIQLKVRDATSGTTYTFNTPATSTGSYSVTTTNLTPCNRKFTVQASGIGGVSAVTTFQTSCGPQLGWGPGNGDNTTAPFTGRFFTPGGKVTLTTVDNTFKLLGQRTVTATSSGTISGTIHCSDKVIASDVATGAASNLLDWPACIY